MNAAEEYAKSRAALLEDLDGIRVEKDTAKRAGYLIFDRPPMNIITFKNRFQIRALLEEMDQDPEVRVIVIRGANGLYSSGGEIAGSSRSTAITCPTWPSTWPRRSGAGSR